MKRAILCFLFFFFLFFILVLTLARTLPTDKKNAVGSVSEINVSKDFFVLTEKQISGHHFNDLPFIQVRNNPRSCKVNLCNCVRSLKKIQDFNEIPFFLFLFFFRDTLRSQLQETFFTWFHFRSSHIWLISYTFVTLHFIVLSKILSILFINASSDKFAKFKTLLFYTKISVE